jgi:hypothetical protein
LSPTCDAHPTARHATQLSQPPVPVAPVVTAEHRHHGVKTVVGERQRLGARLHRWSGVSRPLAEHHRRGFDGQHGPIWRLIRPGARADIEHGLRVG